MHHYIESKLPDLINIRAPRYYFIDMIFFYILISNQSYMCVD